MNKLVDILPDSGEGHYLLTSESVTEGHPDKMCDIISDAILDACLKEDPQAHVAVESVASKGMIFLSGEISSAYMPDVESVVRETILNIGYDRDEKGIDGNTCRILTNITTQSPDIARGVSRADGRIGAGDQGMMYGYACDDTEEYLPLSLVLAHRLARKLADVRKNGILPWLYPDGKTQVTVAYDRQDHILGIRDIVVSAQHSPDISLEYLRGEIRKHVIDPVITPFHRMQGARIHINPTGRFVSGGPYADTGLTGRKIIVDTYGGIARHGGGAFSGKDPTKVDRSAAYMARYAAVNVVAAGLCRACELNLAYAIGVPDPVSVKIDTFGTEEIPIQILEKIIRKEFDFSVGGIIRNLSLTRIPYTPVAAYGHFGRPDLSLPWERTDKAVQLQRDSVTFITDEIIGQLG